MLKTKYKKPNIFNQGFTLVELLVVIFGFSLIVVGLMALFTGIFTSSSQQSGLLADTDQARNLAFGIAGQLRNAVTGSNGAYVLDTAATGTLIFYAPGPGNSTSSIERIRYFVQSGKLWEGQTLYNGASYNTSTEAVAIVQKDLANSSSSPVFYYYDGSYTGSSTQSSLAQPVNVTQVKYVKINLQIYDKAGVKNTNTYTVAASAAIRNLKTNLGN